MRASPRSRPRSNRARFAFLKYPPFEFGETSDDSGVGLIRPRQLLTRFLPD
jgi:hypothetical protein